MYSDLHNQLPVFSAHALSAHRLQRQAKWAFYPAHTEYQGPFVQSHGPHCQVMLELDYVTILTSSGCGEDEKINTPLSFYG